MKTDQVAQQVIDGFSGTYTHFKEFRQSQEHRPYWDECIGSLRDRDFLVCVVFCNDVFGIPPVKTFLTRHRDEFILLTGRADARLNIFMAIELGPKCVNADFLSFLGAAS